MNRIAVVVVTYNRVKSLERLLNSLEDASYDNDDVDLIISIDKSDLETDIIKVAEKYTWINGTKHIRTFSEKQGLKNHILKCGDLVEEYDAVIVFEDDIVASKNYYLYSKNALEYYKNDDRIAGIALYTPQINVMSGQPFVAMSSDADVFFMQVAQSWGQCWSKTMWIEFREWYKDNSGELAWEVDIPAKVLNWPSSSWLKYYMRFIVKTNKYFVYSYTSLSTNSSEVGEHSRTSCTTFQVPLSYGKKVFSYLPLDDGPKYDIFFERQDLASTALLEITDDNLCVDLYNLKSSNNNKRFILTKRKMNYKIIVSFGLKLKPHEANIINAVDGNDIFLYDLINKKDVVIKGKIDPKSKTYYNSVSWKDAIYIALYGMHDAIVNKLSKLKF